jgi:hypothetical protein
MYLAISILSTTSKSIYLNLRIKFDEPGFFIASSLSTRKVNLVLLTTGVLIYLRMPRMERYYV